MIGWSTYLQLFVLTASLLALAPVLATNDSLFPGASINGTQTLVSAGGTFALGFCNPGGTNYYLGIWYSNIPDQTVVWVANRDRPIIGSARAATTLLTLTDSGKLVLTSGGLVVWSTGVGNSGNYLARLTDDGNLGVMERSSGVYAWQSFDHPTDTVLPEMKIRVSRRTGQGTVVGSWRNTTDPATGDYTYGMTIHGYPQVSFDYKSFPRWRSGPLVGWYWTYPPGFGPKDTVFNFVQTEEEAYFVFRVKNKSTLIRLVVNQTAGVLQRWVWRPGAGGWDYGGYSPKVRCDRYGECGPNGVCSPSKCECLEGFEPRMPGNWSAGCVRRTALDCRLEGTTDGFVKVSGVKMPDSGWPQLEAVEDMGWQAAAQCEDTCRTNCSCTAYAPAPDGTSCLMWFGDLLDLGTPGFSGQELFVRVAAADIVYKHTDSGLRRKLTSGGVVVGAFLFAAILAGTAGYLIKRRRRKASGRENSVLEDSDLPLLDFGTVSAATNNFSEQNVLGEGGFGTVFKGKLGEGQEIAVKRLSWDSKQGLEEFKTEVVLIAKLQHKNLTETKVPCLIGQLATRSSLE